MMELVDMLGLGSSSYLRVRVQVPFLVKFLLFHSLSLNFAFLAQLDRATAF